MTTDSNTSNDTDLKKELINSTEIDLISVEEDVVQLSGFVTDDLAMLGGDDVAELLQRLSSAEDMAEGMEGKLDNVLESLDNLLQLLGDIGEGKQTPTSQDDPILEAAPDIEDSGERLDDADSKSAPSS
ncbi:hypothetical protein BDN70DRAFT_869843 [Pholiota conissans]|uniref:Uncharacterized protein n=1 Tax=Pholiota conissans TaxID=109636 RepID=A0A9P5ZFU7_9AGAR|nr:hypothetical protein BDN70DRAFT_869843 [Pholiota conissans]